MEESDLKFTGALKSPDDNRDYIAESIYARETNFPETLDYRKDLLSVRDQRSQSSCFAFAAACVKEWQEKKDVGLDEYMSPQFIYNNRMNYNMAGMYGRDVMKILLEYGSCLERTYPYGRIEPKDEISQKVYDEAENYRIQSYARVNTIDGVKKALYKNGPCIISFPYFNSKSEFWKPYSPDDYRRGGHAVAIVGYNEEGFILRNSWGRSWNGNGYTIYKYSDFGLHWEIWTTVDESSPIPEPRPLTCFGKIKKFIKQIFGL